MSERYDALMASMRCFSLDQSDMKNNERPRYTLIAGVMRREKENKVRPSM
jgi:hypothetical protein